ncbi:hypothetical protein HG530_015565 [Fusarium avenaceum]|nr:hypothetical protein HG530_015565 [Fusarium avenaceum]
MFPSSPALPCLLLFHLLCRERAELVLNGNNLVCALLAGLDHFAVFVRDIVSCLKNNTTLALLSVGATCIGELKRRCAPELEENIHFVTLRVNRLGDVNSSTTLAGLVRDTGDGEIARLLSDTAEVGRLRLGIPSAVEVAEVLTRNSHAIRVGVNGGDSVSLSRRAGLMLDLDLNIERGNSILEGLPWFRETSRRLGVYALQDTFEVSMEMAAFASAASKSLRLKALAPCKDFAIPGLKPLTFKVDLKAINVAFANGLLDESAIFRTDTRSGALVVSDINEFIDTLRFDQQIVIRVVRTLGQHFAITIEVLVRNFERRFSFQTQGQSQVCIFNGHELLFVLNEAKRGSRLLASHGDLDLVLEESLTSPLVLDAAQGKDVLSSLSEGIGLNSEAVILNASDTLRFALAIVNNLPLQVERCLAVK